MPLHVSSYDIVTLRAIMNDNLENCQIHRLKKILLSEFQNK